MTEEQKEKARQEDRRDYAFYKSIGICPKCRKRKPEGTRVHCPVCLKRAREAEMRWMKKGGNEYEQRNLI